MMWERRGTDKCGREWLAAIKSHFNLTKQKCSSWISYCPQLVVSFHPHSLQTPSQMCQFLNNTDFDISHNIEWLKNHYNQQSLQSTVWNGYKILKCLYCQLLTHWSKLQTISNLWLSHHLMHCGWDSDLLKTCSKGKREKVPCFSKNWNGFFPCFYILYLQQVCSMLTRQILDSIFL